MFSVGKESFASEVSNDDRAEPVRWLVGVGCSLGKGGPYTRKRTIPTNPATPAQIAQRDRFGDFAKSWTSDLAQSQRDGWNEFALLNPITDTLGQTILMSGEQAYIRINSRIAAAGFTRIEDAPPDQLVQSVGLTEYQFDLNGPVIQALYTTTPATGETVQIFATPAYSPGITFIKNRTRLIFTEELSSVSPASFDAEWTAKFGTLPVIGRKASIIIRMIKSTTGAISVPERADTIVVNTV